MNNAQDYSIDDPSLTISNTSKLDIINEKFAEKNGLLE